LLGSSDTLIDTERLAQALQGAAFPIIPTDWAARVLFAATALERKTQIAG
jgi:hypothetical protein